MAMALKRDVVEARQREGNAKPVDLVHLGNQTMGDEALETEILSIFKSQSQIYMKMMLNSCDVTNRIRAAHSLKGAARGIGAFELAERAAEVEFPRHGGYEGVETELNRVIDYIERLG